MVVQFVAAIVVLPAVIFLAAGTLRWWNAWAYFAALVRIQTERGHTVVTDGPYRIVRHPSYAGGLLANVGVPLLLGSWWAAIPAVVIVALTVVRTALEDGKLQRELPGYAACADRTRYPLVPGVW